MLRILQNWPYLFLFTFLACNSKPAKVNQKSLSSIPFENKVYEFAQSVNPQSCNSDSIPVSDCAGGYLFLTADGKAILLNECIGDDDVTYYLGPYTKGDTGIACTFSDKCSIPYPHKFDSGINIPNYDAAVVGKVKTFSLQLNTLSCDKFDFYSQKQVEANKNAKGGCLKFAYWKADSIYARVFLKNAMQAKFLSEWFHSHADKASLANISLDTLPVNRVMDFLQWYAIHLPALNKIEMVNTAANGDSTKFYSVNFPGTEKYLSEMSSSGFVSNVYLDSQRAYFKRCNDSLLKNTQNDGPPYGFDYDLVMFSQEYDEDLAHLEKARIKFQEVKGNTATLTLTFSTKQQLQFSLKKKGGKWMIEKIDAESVVVKVKSSTY
jgi:hypothetical protein